MDFDFLNLGIPQMNFKAGEGLIDGKKWLMITWEDNGAGWSWDDMPVEVRDGYLRARKKSRTFVFLTCECPYQNSAE